MVKIKKNEYYKTQILNLIYNKQPISRIRIGEITGIRLATITEIVRELIKEGLVKETGKIRNRQGVGRREKILEIIPEGKFFIGCELRPGEIQTLLLNFKGEIVHTELCSISPEQKSNEVLVNIKSIINLLVKKAGIPYKKIYGMGFVDPGVIDVEKGISISSTIMPSWKNVPVRKYLEQELRFRVFLINTPQAKVLAEHLFGKGRGISDLVFIEYGDGIACGIISDGKPIGGYMEIAGEMGHFNFPGREEKCRCGNRGCLEAIASIHSIEDRMRKIVKDSVSIEDIVCAFERREPPAVEVLNDVSEVLGIAVANVVKLLNPEVVVFDRNFKRMGNKFVDRMFKNIKKNIIFGEKVMFKISDMGKEQGALGGAALTLQNFLKKT
ncbi:MAG: ROK family transcriptional regulator [Candidatus Omnitrophica bacterium]|nr:ROK family transcriptional regulator [Candidatus Omnitrophota bacterium]